MEHPLVQLARKTIEKYVRERKVIEPPKELTEEMRQKAGVFVSLHRRNALRGCIGTFLPTQENVAMEIIKNAISAATQDPRFPPVTEEELDDLEISVDVLSPPEPVKNISELDAKKYGIIVSSGYKRGLLLPDLEGVDTPEEQIDICRKKAGILPYEDIQISRFTVKRYH